MTPTSKSLQNEDWDEGDIIIKGGKNIPKNYSATAEEIEAVRRLLLIPITEFNQKRLVQPTFLEHTACINCSQSHICEQRVRLRLPVVCEQPYKADELFLGRYTEEKLKELHIVE
jgi:hypothetical protein